MSSLPRKSCVFGSWPIAMKTPSLVTSRSEPSLVFSSVAPATPPCFQSPWIFETAAFHTKSTFGFRVAGSEEGPDALRLLAEQSQHFGAGPPHREPGIVLDLGRDRQQCTGLRSGYNERLQVRARRVQRRGQPRGTGAENDHFMQIFDF